MRNPKAKTQGVGGRFRPCAELWEHVLLDAGYEIDIAETVEAACGRIAAHAYDLVIADGLLADGTA